MIFPKARRKFPGGNKVSPFVPAEPEDDFQLNECTVFGLQKALSEGSTDSVEIVGLYLKRIAEIDQAGPALSSIAELNPLALQEAAALDAERKAGRLRGPLHGMPVLIKDNIDVRGLRCTAGSLALENFFPASDAFLVSRLRAAGAIILGKTNMSEWAFYMSSSGVSGWSARGGQVKNPYALDRSPYGSSSGTAVALAANLSVLGIGTETDGSITGPAALNGIVGIKPTRGLVSRSGIIPLAESFDTAGPMARTVTDAVLLLSAIAGSDPADEATRGIPPALERDFSSFLRPGALAGARLGIIRNSLLDDNDTRQEFESMLESLRGAGAVIAEADPLPQNAWREAEYEVLRYEFKICLEKYLAEHPESPVKTLGQIVDFNNAQAEKELLFFDQDLLEDALHTRIDPDACIEFRKRARALAGPLGIDAVMDKYGLDALLAVETTAAWLTDYVSGDLPHEVSGSIAAVAGYPSLCLPLGSKYGLPLGAIFMGRAWSEGKLAGLAYAWEQLSRKRFPPSFQKTIRFSPDFARA
jgi:amidase